MEWAQLEVIKSGMVVNPDALQSVNSVGELYSHVALRMYNGIGPRWRRCFELMIHSQTFLDLVKELWSRVSRA